MSEDSSEPMPKAKPSPIPEEKWGWGASLGVSVLAIILAQFAAALMVILLDWDVETLSQTQTYLVGIVAVALPLLGVFLYLRKKKANIKDLGLKKRPEPYVKPVLKTLGLYILSTMAALLILSALAPSVDLDQVQDLGLGDGPSIWYEYVLLGLLLIAVTPISEEVIFRGFMLKGLAAKFGWTAAAAVTALLFGLAHGQLNVAIDTAIMGWFSAQLVITTGSVWPSITLHALKNTIAFSLVYLVPLVS